MIALLPARGGGQVRAASRDQKIQTARLLSFRCTATPQSLFRCQVQTDATSTATHLMRGLQHTSAGSVVENASQRALVLPPSGLVRQQPPSESVVACLAKVGASARGAKPPTKITAVG